MVMFADGDVCIDADCLCICRSASFEVELAGLAGQVSFFASVLAQADPTVHVTCVDRSEVLKVTHDLAKRLQVVDQVTLLPGDLYH
jgi:hypothetical protein